MQDIHVYNKKFFISSIGDGCHSSPKIIEFNKIKNPPKNMLMPLARIKEYPNVNIFFKITHPHTLKNTANNKASSDKEKIKKFSILNSSVVLK